jgi:hypothetical protein
VIGNATGHGSPRGDVNVNVNDGRCHVARPPVAREIGAGVLDLGHGPRGLGYP